MLQPQTAPPSYSSFASGGASAPQAPGGPLPHSHHAPRYVSVPSVVAAAAPAFSAPGYGASAYGSGSGSGSGSLAYPSAPPAPVDPLIPMIYSHSPAAPAHASAPAGAAVYVTTPGPLQYSSSPAPAQAPRRKVAARRVTHESAPIHSGSPNLTPRPSTSVSFAFEGGTGGGTGGEGYPYLPEAPAAVAAAACVPPRRSGGLLWGLLTLISGISLAVIGASINMFNPVLGTVLFGIGIVLISCVGGMLTCCRRSCST